MQADDVKRMIETGLPESRAMVQGDGDHFEAQVISTEFAGKSLIEQHRMVYATLGDSMQAEIHALSMRTFTPETWAATGQD